MASLTYLLILTLLSYSSNHARGRHPPSSGYYPSSSILPTSFLQGFETLWGPQHQTLHRDILTLWLDHSSGSGFKSKKRYDSGYFGAAIKLQEGFTAGVITSFYLSNNEDYPGHHDEIDIELLGTIPGEPYTLQTNVYVRGSGDPGNVIGREMKFHLWFDPARHFHNYSILWTPSQIVFFVDDVPIRRYPRKSEATFPMRPMWVYGSIWDASSWATDNGKHPADYRYEPFVSRYRDFRLHASPQGFTGLTSKQEAAMVWVQNNFLVYNYCTDPSRNHALTPEC